MNNNNNSNNKRIETENNCLIGALSNGEARRNEEIPKPRTGNSKQAIKRNKADALAKKFELLTKKLMENKVETTDMVDESLISFLNDFGQMKVLTEDQLPSDPLKLCKNFTIEINDLGLFPAIQKLDNSNYDTNHLNSISDNNNFKEEEPVEQQEGEDANIVDDIDYGESEIENDFDNGLVGDDGADDDDDKVVIIKETLFN